MPRLAQQPRRARRRRRANVYLVRPPRVRALGPRSPNNLAVFVAAERGRNSFAKRSVSVVARTVVMLVNPFLGKCKRARAQSREGLEIFEGVERSFGFAGAFSLMPQALEAGFDFHGASLSAQWSNARIQQCALFQDQYQARGNEHATDGDIGA